MRYYKIVKDRTVLGVATSIDFVKFQPKKCLLLASNDLFGQYIQCNGVVYRDSWMNAPMNEVIKYVEATVLTISEDEYTKLKGLLGQDEVVVEPEQEVIPPEEPVVDEIDAATIKTCKPKVLASMRKKCNEVIESGFDIVLSDGESHHFSLTTQDQINLSNLSTRLASGDNQIPYHADGEECRYFTTFDMLRVMQESTKVITYHTTYFNSLKSYINAIEDVEELLAVEYGMAIPVKYQSQVLTDLYKLYV